MSLKSTQSEFQAASEVCGSGKKFGIWADEVSLRFLPRLSLPVALKELVAESRRLPQWLFHQDSNEYKQFKLISDQDLSYVPSWLDRTEDRTAAVDDDKLSQSMFRVLDRVLHVCQLHDSLSDEGGHVPSYNESDLRQALDDLARHVWFTETGPKQGYLFRSECVLKLPRTKKIKIADSTVDSVAFFSQSKPGYSIPTSLRKQAATLNSMVQRSPHLYLVHWVTEYKTSATEEVKRQVLYGMTSGLYQRRALGRLDDFVFGTAHSGYDLVVYAARWQKIVQKSPSEAGQPPDLSNQNEGNTAIHPDLEDTPAATAKRRSGSNKSLSVKDAAAGPSGEGVPNRAIKSGSEKSSSEAGQPPDISNQNEGNTAIHPDLEDTPAATAKRRSGSNKSLSVKATAAGPSGEGVPNREIKSGSVATPSLVEDDGGSINKGFGYEIVVYQLGEYVTRDPRHMIKYYLLMRASRKLADGYRTGLFTDPWLDVTIRLETSPIFDWPSPPRPRAKGPSGLQTVHENDTPAGEGGRQVQLADTELDASSVASEPEDAVEWKEEWMYDREVAIEECGPASLKGFRSAKSGIEELGLEDRVSVYLSGLSH